MNEYQMFSKVTFKSDRYLQSKISTTSHIVATPSLRQESTMKFRPCIDLHSGQVKQIVGSTLIDDKQNALTAKSDSTPAENFATDTPAKEYAEMYRRDGLTGGHVIMLGPGNEEAVRFHGLRLFDLVCFLWSCLVFGYYKYLSV